MEIIKVNSIERAAYLTYLEVRNKSKINIALTGGNFCNAFINQVIENQLDINSWNIFFTDERITSESEEINSLILCDKLKEAINFNPSNVFPFNHQSLDDSYSELTKVLDGNDIHNFDITILSLGEDGHLAGHFHNSYKSSDSRFCYTNHSPKPPKRRISFDIGWLSSSSKIILAAIGRSKFEALRELINGNSFHSRILSSNNLILLTDIDINQSN